MLINTSVIGLEECLLLSLSAKQLEYSIINFCPTLSSQVLFGTPRLLRVHQNGASKLSPPQADMSSLVDVIAPVCLCPPLRQLY
jgi:hypothetical protein